MTTADTTSTKPTASVVFVDADTAARWLGANAKNRHLRQAIVENYRRDMVEGRWVYAADPIRFDNAGRLIDGQHRLTALVKARIVTIPLLVVRNLTPESQYFMDAGIARTASDQLGMRGVRDAAIVAAASNLVIRFDVGKVNTSAGVVSKAETQQWVTDHPVIHSSAQTARRLSQLVDAPPSVVAAAHFMFSRVNADLASMFFDDLRTRADLPEGSPIIALDNRLRQARRMRENLRQHDYLGYLIRAWNAYGAGRTMERIQGPKGGRWTAQNFPVPR